jgi:chlorosome envelope protein F
MAHAVFLSDLIVLYLLSNEHVSRCIPSGNMYGIFCKQNIPYFITTHISMANSNGVFSDLFNAIGNPVQNVADTVGNGVNSAVSLVESCTNLCATLLTSSVNTASRLVQDVSNGISSAITPKP